MNASCVDMYYLLACRIINARRSKRFRLGTTVPVERSIIRPPRRFAIGRSDTRNTTMIICTRAEGHGAFRTFLVDDSGPLIRVPVITHLAKAREASIESSIVAQEAGEVHRTDEGVEASIAVTSGCGFSTSTDLVKLSGVFRNEVDALIAIAVGYDSGVRSGS